MRNLDRAPTGPYFSNHILFDSPKISDSYMFFGVCVCTDLELGMIASPHRNNKIDICDL